MRPADKISDGVLVGCRKCAPLDGSAVRLHVRVLAPDAVTAEALVPAPVAAVRPFEAAESVERLWRRACSVERSPGAHYLRSVRRCWDRLPFPASVRWLPATSRLFHAMRPAPPDGAAVVEDSLGERFTSSVTEGTLVCFIGPTPIRRSAHSCPTVAITR